MSEQSTNGDEATVQGKEIVRHWFDQLEENLRGEAQLAGLLGHGSMIGSAREFFVSRVLRSLLPPLVHIGTGQVIGVEGISKQIDMVLYNSRFPLLEAQPGGVYALLLPRLADFADGVCEMESEAKDQ